MTSAKLVVPTMYESLLAFVLGVVISLGYALAGQLPGGTLVADALLRGVAVGLTTAGLIATVRRFALERRTSRR